MDRSKNRRRKIEFVTLSTRLSGVRYSQHSQSPNLDEASYGDIVVTVCNVHSTQPSGPTISATGNDEWVSTDTVQERLSDAPVGFRTQLGTPTLQTFPKFNDPPTHFQVMQRLRQRQNIWGQGGVGAPRRSLAEGRVVVAVTVRRIEVSEHALTAPLNRLTDLSASLTSSEVKRDILLHDDHSTYRSTRRSRFLRFD